MKSLVMIFSIFTKKLREELDRVGGCAKNTPPPESRDSLKIPRGRFLGLPTLKGADGKARQALPRTFVFPLLLSARVGIVSYWSASFKVGIF